MSSRLFVSAIVAAGGRGQRFGHSRPKQLLEVAGRAVLDRSVAAFASHPRIREVVVALPPDVAAAPPGYLNAGAAVTIATGGARRQDSVANAFALVDSRADIVLIHDAARPFVSAAVIDRTIDAAAEAGAALAAIHARDTVKQASPERETAGEAAGVRYVAGTLPRETIFLAQTPQGFRRDVLRDALALCAREQLEVTDEATLVERAGHAVRIVEGEATNIKITTPEDLAMAEAIARGAAAPARTGRAGTGYDLHRLVAGRPLVIGGVVVPADRGALGHSDADVVCHAVTDAVLGALGLGDIGSHFPDSDERWRDASSVDLLARVAGMATGQGFEIGNVDVTVVLESPKIRDYIEPMRAAVARALGVGADRVSIKGKTNEGVDAVGRGEAIAAHAVALLRRI